MKKIVGILIGIVIIGICIFGFLLLPEKKEKNSFESVPITEERVKKLYELANPSDNYSTMADVYKRETFSNEFILGTAFVAFLKDHPNYEQEIKEEEIDLYVKKIFGNVTYAHTTGYIVSKELCNFRYHKNTSSYEYLTGCDGSLNTSIIKKLESAKKSDTEYILRERIIVTESNWDLLIGTEEKEATMKIYGDINENKLLKEIKYDYEKEGPKIKIEDYWDFASIYEYHFKFDGENFIYQKLEKVE